MHGLAFRQDKVLSSERSSRSGHVPLAEQGGVSLRRSLTRLLKGKVEVRLPRTWGGVFRNDYDHRDFCAIGASAGAQRSVLYLLRAVPWREPHKPWLPVSSWRQVLSLRGACLRHLRVGRLWLLCAQ